MFKYSKKYKIELVINEPIPISNEMCFVVSVHMIGGLIILLYESVKGIIDKNESKKVKKSKMTHT